MRRLARCFLQSRGRARVDDRLVLPGLVSVIRNGPRWRGAPSASDPHKTLDNRFERWSRAGVFARIFADLTSEGGARDQLMVDATHLKARRTAAALLTRGALRAGSAALASKII